MRRLVLLAVVALAGCASSTPVALRPQPSGTPVSAPFTQSFVARSEAWLAAQPPYHRSGHHNGILLASALNGAGFWHGLAVEPNGTVQPLAAQVFDENQRPYYASSDAIAEQVAVGDEVEFSYHHADGLRMVGGALDIAVMVRGAVTP